MLALSQSKKNFRTTASHNTDTGLALATNHRGEPAERRQPARRRFHSYGHRRRAARGRGIPAAGKRGRFGNERSGSVSQGEGAYQQHTEDGEPMTPKQKLRQRKRIWYFVRNATPVRDHDRREDASPNQTRPFQRSGRSLKADWLDERPTSNRAVRQRVLLPAGYGLARRRPHSPPPSPRDLQCCLKVRPVGTACARHRAPPR